MLHLFNLIQNSIHNSYQINELVSREHREQIDLRQFDDKIHSSLRLVFGDELEQLHIGTGFYAYKLNG